MKHSGYAVGILLLSAAALAYSTAGLFTKGVEAGAWEVIFWRGLFAALATGAWAVAVGGPRRAVLRLGRAGWAIGIIGAVGTAAFIPAFKLTSIANVSLIYAIAPIFAAVLAWLAIGERIGRRTMLGCAGAVLGVGIIVWGSVGAIRLAGDALALVMTIAMATIMVIYRARPETPSAGPSILQSLLLLPVSAVFGAPFETDAAEIAVLAAFGILFAIATVALAEGAKRVPSGQTALLSALETPLAPVLAFLVLAEVPAPATLVGGGIVLAAVLLAIRDTAEPEQP